MVNKMSCPECLGRDYGNFADVMVERQRQREEYGDPILSPAARLAILVEEVGEVARVISEPWDRRARGEPVTLEFDRAAYRRELVQVAAVAVAALEAVGHV